MTEVQSNVRGRPRASRRRSATLTTAVPLLPEIGLALTRLRARGEETVLDLRDAPLGPEDERLLFDALERDAELCQARHCGSCRIHETAAPCVWIVEHLDPGGDVTAKFIEVSWCPGPLERLSPDLDDEFFAPAPPRRHRAGRPI